MSREVLSNEPRHNICSPLSEGGTLVLTGDRGEQGRGLPSGPPAPFTLLPKVESVCEVSVNDIRKNKGSYCLKLCLGNRVRYSYP